MKGRVVGFRGGVHKDVEDLLPWYVTGQLEAAEREQVEAHLNVCAACREELEFQRQLEAQIAHLPLDVEQGWSRMRQRRRQEARPGRGAMALAWRSSVAWRGWALAGALAVVAAVWVSPLVQPGLYHALGAKPTAAAGNLMVVFKPDTPEHSLREALRANHARLVGGPTEADAYVLSVPPAERAAALAGLRQRAEIVVAEPIDPAP